MNINQLASLQFGQYKAGLSGAFGQPSIGSTLFTVAAGLSTVALSFMQVAVNSADNSIAGVLYNWLPCVPQGPAADEVVTVEMAEVLGASQVADHAVKTVKANKAG